MVIRELINKSTYGTIGYISSSYDINLFERYLQFNLSILEQFDKIIIALNYNDISLIELFKDKIKIYLTNPIILINPENRGHNHGCADLDNLLFDYCKENNIKWLCKSTNDIIIDEKILDKQIGKADFYYFNGIGIGSMVKYNFDNEKIINDDFYPQTNFYFIDISKTDYLNDKQYLDNTYNVIQNIHNYNGRIWEYIQGWSCEDFLKQCVKRNNLIKEHLIPESQYISLLNLIKSNNIYDPSHKNIMIEGICHLHYPEQGVYKI